MVLEVENLVFLPELVNKNVIFTNINCGKAKRSCG